MMDDGRKKWKIEDRGSRIEDGTREWKLENLKFKPPTSKCDLQNWKWTPRSCISGAYVVYSRTS
jgi:hypothetical protein